MMSMDEFKKLFFQTGENSKIAALVGMSIGILGCIDCGMRVPIPLLTFVRRFRRSHRRICPLGGARSTRGALGRPASASAAASVLLTVYVKAGLVGSSASVSVAAIAVVRS